MASISSLGIGSGLDLNSLIGKLMEAEKAPLMALDKKEVDFQAKLTAYGTLKGAFSSFQTAARGLSSPSKFNTAKASAADATVLSANASSIAKPGSYAIEVSKLAQSHKIASAPFDAPSSAIGAGTLTIDFGTYDGDTNEFAVNADKTSKSITIDNSNNSLAGIRDTINAAGAGVTASIVNDGEGYRLVLSSNDSGAANSLRVIVDEGDSGHPEYNTDASGLSQLAYDPTASAGSGKNLEQKLAAQNAELTIDGIAISKPGNLISDAITGVTLNLLKANVASPTTLTVARDPAGVKTAVEDFVKAYNELATTMKELGGYDFKTQKGGLLLGDTALRNMQNQARNILTQRLEYADGGVQSLSDIGVSFQRDGTLSLNSSKLDTVLADPAKNVAALFATMGVPSDSLTTYAGSTANTQPGRYGLNITQTATRGTVVGSNSVSEPTVIGAGNRTLKLKLDGTAATITLSDGSYTRAQLVAEIQSKINSDSTYKAQGKKVSVSESGGYLRIASESYGSASKVEITESALFGTPSTQARAIGSVVAATTITVASITTSANNTLDLSVDGNDVSVTLTAGTYTAATLAAHLQTQINTALGGRASVAVGESGGKLTVTSASSGDDSFVFLKGGTGLSALFGTPDHIAQKGRDVAGDIGGIAATGKGQMLTGSGNATGLQLLIEGGSIGARGTVGFSQGLARQLDQTITTLLGEDGTLSSRTEGIDRSIEDIESRRATLSRRLESIEARYRKQFAGLDQLVASMQQTSQYLTQQLANLPNSSSK